LESGKNYYGPSLWNAVGRTRGSVSDFAYSQAFSALDGDWTFDALNEFLARPTEVIPGNKMKFRGMVDPQKRANLIVFLRTLSDNPVPLPTP
jgi:cytochrome c